MIKEQILKASPKLSRLLSELLRDKHIDEAHMNMIESDISLFEKAIREETAKEVGKAIDDKYESYGWDDGNGDYARKALEALQNKKADEVALNCDCDCHDNEDIEVCNTCEG